MEVELGTPTASFKDLFSLLLPFAADSPHLHPLQDALDELNKSMNGLSSRRSWLRWMESAGFEPEMFFANILVILIGELASKTNFITHINLLHALKLVKNLDDNGLNELQEGVREGLNKHDWVRLASHPIMKPAGLSNHVYLRGNKGALENLLRTAYNKPFVGDIAKRFVEYLEYTDREVRALNKVVYAKAFTVVQSSGTGKSRMLTEAGKYIFTLPICLYGGYTPVYPPPDLEVVSYFDSIEENHLSYSAHIAIACFIAAAHTTMHKWLKDAQGKNVGDLRAYWYDRMEPAGGRDYRNRLFSEVIELANSLKNQHQKLCVEAEGESNGIHAFAKTAYRTIVSGVVNDLMKFLHSIDPDALCVTYFDEAHTLSSSFYVFLRLLGAQDMRTRMWYIFLKTESSSSYCAPKPRPRDVSSLRFLRELATLLPPYVALAFDQHAIANRRSPRTVSMGELQSIMHLSQYGRPLWNAQLPESEDHEIIELASLKLTNGMPFCPTDKDHVFAVLSQRLCLDSVLCLDPELSSSKAVELAIDGVAHHMRLLLTDSDNGAFYTYSSSEPILALGSGYILHDTRMPNHLLKSLSTLNVDLCSAGLIETGLMGELAARTLLLVARDFAAPTQVCGRDLLKPVRLLDFLDTLFGDKEWAGSAQSEFNGAFADAYVNFTHWVVTKNPMPVELDSMLLANLWARGVALQFCFEHKPIEFLIPVYHGPFDTDAVFRPSRLSGILGQVAPKFPGGSRAEAWGRPFDILSDSQDPLPYLTLLMELRSQYQGHSKIIKAPSGSTPDGELSGLAALDMAIREQESRPQQVGKRGDELETLNQAIRDTQLAVDSHHRYSIFVRGASPDSYGILKTANIVQEFHTLVELTTRFTGNSETLQHMFPSNHYAWMSKFATA